MVTVEQLEVDVSSELFSVNVLLSLSLRVQLVQSTGISVSGLYCLRHSIASLFTVFDCSRVLFMRVRHQSTVDITPMKPSLSLDICASHFLITLPILLIILPAIN